MGNVGARFSQGRRTRGKKTDGFFFLVLQHQFWLFLFNCPLWDGGSMLNRWSFLLSSAPELTVGASVRLCCLLWRSIVWLLLSSCKNVQSMLTNYLSRCSTKKYTVEPQKYIVELIFFFLHENRYSRLTRERISGCTCVNRQGGCIFLTCCSHPVKTRG